MMVIVVNKIEKYLQKYKLEQQAEAKNSFFWQFRHPPVTSNKKIGKIGKKKFVDFLASRGWWGGGLKGVI